MAFVERRFASLYSLFFSVFVLFGVSMTVVGATLPRILADFRWSYGGAGLVMAASSIAYFLSTYATGKILPFLGLRPTLALGISFIAVGLAFFAATPSLALNILLYAAVGVGHGLVEVVINYSVIRIDGSGRAMNLVHAAFSTGAVAGPFAVGFFMRANLAWTMVYRVIAAVFCLVFAAAFALPFGKLPRPAARPGGVRSARRGSAYALGFATLFLYVAVEGGISNWIAELFVRVFHASEALGSFMVSLFWIGLLAGRVGIPLILPKAKPDRTLLALAVGTALASGLIAACALVGSAAMPLAVAAAVAAGLSCSCFYPIVMTLLSRAYPEAQAEVIGFAGTGGGIGSFVFMLLMSRIAQAFGLGGGFLFYAAIAVLNAAATFALVGAVRSRITLSAATGA
jgi:fucose permease